jgi:hypothetical protein
MPYAEPIAAAALTPGMVFAADDDLTQCVRNAVVIQGTSIDQAVMFNCASTRSQWMAACIARNGGWEDLHAGSTCQEELTSLKEGLRGFERQAQARKRSENEGRSRAAAMSAALADAKAGRPLPGLPRLDAPVYVQADAMVCESLGALANPNQAVSLLTKTCTLVTQKQRVQVSLPADFQQYIEMHAWGAVRVSWRSAQSSVANVYTGWVKVTELRN